MVTAEQREQRIQDLSLPCLVAFPARRCPLPHHAVDLQCQRDLVISVVGARFSHPSGLGAPRLENPRQVVIDHRGLPLAVQRLGYALVGLLPDQPFHQRRGLPEELFVRGGIGPVLLDEVVEQLGHLLVLATESGADLWHTPAGNGCITFAVNGHREHHPLASRATRDHLTRIFYFDSRTAPNATAMQAAIGTLSGIARFEGGEHDLHIRVAGHRGCIYLDLADRQWTAVEISANGWRLIREPPVRFRRTRGMLPLPVPAPGGSLAEMRPFVNVSSEGDFALVGSWLLAALRPNGPYPPLALMGEQGTAKTTTERVLRRMTDPNVADVRSEPRDARDLAVAADNGWVIAFDNLSRLPEWLSDALCRLATGGGFSTRTLYENREEEIFEAMRPVIINGITQVASRPDLIDRAIVVTLPVIEDRERRGEDDFWRAFDAARPRMLGALLDAVSCGLRRLPHVQLARKPRMADFAKWSVAVEPACPWSEGTFLLAYERNRQGAVEATLDGDPVADVVEAIAPWSGTASELLAELANRTSDNITQRRGWFSRPRQVSDTLRRLAAPVPSDRPAPSLRQGCTYASEDYQLLLDARGTVCSVDQMTAMVRGMDGKRLRYRTLIASNGLASGARS